MGDSPLEHGINPALLGQGAGGLTTEVCGVTEPTVQQRLTDLFRQLQGGDEPRFWTDVTTAIATVSKQDLTVLFLAETVIEEFLTVIDAQQIDITNAHWMAIALVEREEDTEIERLRQRGIADYLCLAGLTLPQLRRCLRHCHQVHHLQRQRQTIATSDHLILEGSWARENARLYDERQAAYDELQEAIAKLTQQQQRLETLQHLTTLINQRLTNIPELLEVLTQQICADVPAVQVCAIALFNPQQQQDLLVITDDHQSQCLGDRRPVALTEQLKHDLYHEQGWLHSVYTEGKPQIRNGAVYTAYPCSMAAVAIESLAAGRLGVLVVANWYISQAFDLEDCEFLTAVGEEAAIAIDNARLIKTLEQQNQELSETSRVKDLFLAIVSHELRTPMNAILGFSQVLLNHELGDRQQQIVERILSNGRSLMALINDILDCSQMRLTALQLLPSTFNLESLVADIVTELQSLADEKQLNFTLTSYLTHPLITHDQKRLRQVLVNLIANALGFTHQGSVTITLWDGMESNTEKIYLQIKDTGIGIAPEHLKHIFSEFWQARQDIHLSKSGTGLGLAITHGLVQRMQGAIAVESELNQGSTFTVTLPRNLNSGQ